jgi:AAA domain
MKILGFMAENYKRLRIVEIAPKGNLVQITGKNGQGKTSVLDAIWSALAGSKAIPEKPVRKGADRAKIKLDLGELTVTRTITPTGTHTLIVENKGVKVREPQGILDELVGSLSFDPLEFISMKPKEQIESLRSVSQISLDIDALNAQSRSDYEKRSEHNREIKRLEAETSAITVQENLPKEPIDESIILNLISAADGANAKARELDERRQAANIAVQAAKQTLESENLKLKVAEAKITELKNLVRELQQSIATAELKHERLETKLEEIETAAYVEVAPLTQKLQEAQIVNREIGRRTKRDAIRAQLALERQKADGFTRAMEEREEQKRAAIHGAKMPVEGLTFDENAVLYNGIPIEQLGTAEQIRISTSIAMAANPKLRVIRIMHGEALDDDSLAILAMMAEQHDFQIWMARVDTTGKAGIIMEDGSAVTAYPSEEAGK